MDRYRTRRSPQTRLRRSCPSRSRRSLAAVVVAGLALTGCVRASGSEASRSAAGRPDPTTAGPVRAAQLVTAAGGWALSPRGLAWTDDGGASWRDITPARAPVPGVRGAFFLDGAHGWVVASRGGAAGAVALGAFRTSDGGRTWTAATVAGPSAANADAYGGPAWVRFVDPLHGWVLVKDVSSSNFSFGRLYRTGDGGRSWSAMRAPLGDPVTFVDQRTGWTAGGPAGDSLFVTRDAGRTWRRQTVPTSSGSAGDRIAYALPVRADGAMVMSTTLVRGDRATVAWFRSRDAGRTWRLARSVATAEQVGPGVRVPVAAAGPGTWVSVLPSSRRLVRLRGDGATLAVQDRPTAPAGVQELQFSTAAAGWALASGGTCPPGGPCAPGRVLFSTGDGGSTWRKVTVP